MIKNLMILLTVFIISSCSNNEIVTNPVTGKKPIPGIFSKDSEKGISLTDLMNPQNKDGLSVNVNGFL